MNGDRLGLSRASNNFANTFMMGKQRQAEEAQAEEEKARKTKLNSLLGGAMMGQSSPEQMTELAQLDPKMFMGAQQYLQGQKDRVAEQEAAAAQQADVMSQEEDKADLRYLLSSDYATGTEYLTERARIIKERNGDNTQTLQLLSAPEGQRGKIVEMLANEADIKLGQDDVGFTLGKGQQRFDAQGRLIASGITDADGNDNEIGTEQQFFESKLKGLTDAQKEEAILINLGISPRAVSSADITIAESPELTEQIANSKAIIGERKKFGELTGASRSKAIDSGFERIVKIDAAVRNIDKAIGVLNSGAGVGAVERFLPSFKAATVELNNIQKEMALDVIGAVTFGALSKGELDLAKEVALPTGLDSKQLIEHLQNRKVAQGKLRTYFNEQIQFLDQGGTIAGFLREKERGGSDVGALSDDELFN